MEDRPPPAVQVYDAAQEVRRVRQVGDRGTGADFTHRQDIEAVRLAVDGKGQIFVAAGVGPATGYRITAAHADGATSLGRCRQLFHRIPRHACSRHAALPQVFAVSAYPLMSSKSTTKRSEERRVGKEWFRTGRSRWSPYH